jgi:hypothetical protein
LVIVIFELIGDEIVKSEVFIPLFDAVKLGEKNTLLPSVRITAPEVKLDVIVLTKLVPVAPVNPANPRVPVCPCAPLVPVAPCAPVHPVGLWGPWLPVRP